MIINDNNNSFSLVNPFGLNANNNGSNNKNLIVKDITSNKKGDYLK